MSKHPRRGRPRTLLVSVLAIATVLVVAPVHRANASVPTVNAPAAQTVPSGGTLVFSAATGNAISVAHPDGDVRVFMSVQQGTFDLASTSGLTIDSQGTFEMGFSGTVPDIVAALNGLAYHPIAGFSGVDELYLDSSDVMTGEEAVATVPIRVLRDAASPYFDQIPASVRLLEDTPLTFSTATTPFHLTGPAGYYSMTLSADGAWTIPAGNTASFPNGFINGDSWIDAEGTIDQLNTVLDGLVYQPWQDWTDTAYITADVRFLQASAPPATTTTTMPPTTTTTRPPTTTTTAPPTTTITGPPTTTTTRPPTTTTITGPPTTTTTQPGATTTRPPQTTTSTTQPGATTTTAPATTTTTAPPPIDTRPHTVERIPIDFDPVNDAPVNGLPIGASTIMDSPIGLGVLGLTVNDVDSGVAPMTTSLTADSGTFHAPFHGAADVIGDQTSSIAITGSRDDIYSVLYNLEYVPAQGFVGKAIFVMHTDDHGNTGVGGPLTDDDTFTVDVVAPPPPCSTSTTFPTTTVPSTTTTTRPPTTTTTVVGQTTTTRPPTTTTTTCVPATTTTTTNPGGSTTTTGFPTTTAPGGSTTTTRAPTTTTRAPTTTTTRPPSTTTVPPTTVSTTTSTTRPVTTTTTQPPATTTTKKKPLFNFIRWLLCFFFRIGC